MKYKKNIVEKVSGSSDHHLFDYSDVREKLIELFGEPLTDSGHRILHKRIQKCMDVIPVFTIGEILHRKHHQKINSKRTETKKKSFWDKW